MKCYSRAGVASQKQAHKTHAHTTHQNQDVVADIGRLLQLSQSHIPSLSCHHNQTIPRTFLPYLTPLSQSRHVYPVALCLCQQVSCLPHFWTRSPRPLASLATTARKQNAHLKRKKNIQTNLLFIPLSTKYHLLLHIAPKKKQETKSPKALQNCSKMRKSNTPKSIPSRFARNRYLKCFAKSNFVMHRDRIPHLTHPFFVLFLFVLFFSCSSFLYFFCILNNLI